VSFGSAGKVLCICYGSNVCSLPVLEDDRGVEKMTERLVYFCDEISTLIIALGVTIRRLVVLESFRIPSKTVAVRQKSIGLFAMSI
jgi:hypothetical protein